MTDVTNTTTSKPTQPSVTTQPSVAPTKNVKESSNPIQPTQQSSKEKEKEPVLKDDNNKDAIESKNTEKETSKEASKEAPKEAPKEASKEASKESPKETTTTKEIPKESKESKESENKNKNTNDDINNDNDNHAEYDDDGDDNDENLEESKTNLIVNYLPPIMNEGELATIFSVYGAMTNIKIVVDLNTGRSRGYGFVQFENEENAKRALENINGYQIQDKKLKVAYARPQSKKIQNANLYVTGLPSTWDNEKLKSLFVEFGEIVECRILKDEEGKSRGVGFIRMDTHENALKAINGRDKYKYDNDKPPIEVKIAERKIKPFQKFGQDNFQGGANRNTNGGGIGGTGANYRRGGGVNNQRGGGGGVNNFQMGPMNRGNRYGNNYNRQMHQQMMPRGGGQRGGSNVNMMNAPPPHRNNSQQGGNQYYRQKGMNNGGHQGGNVNFGNNRGGGMRYGGGGGGGRGNRIVDNNMGGPFPDPQMQNFYPMYDYGVQNTMAQQPSYYGQNPMVSNNVLTSPQNLPSNMPNQQGIPTSSSSSSSSAARSYGPTVNIIVYNLPPHFNVDHLIQLYASYGPIQSVNIQKTSNNKNYGIISYFFFAHAQRAQNETNGKICGDRKLEVHLEQK